MIMRLVLPRYEKVHFLSGICSLFMRKEDEVHYIGGAEILPPPLEGEREAYCIRMLDGVHAERARKELIEHNLRLVVYIAKKFDNTGVGVEDLISIGTIGLIKGINTFNPDKNIKLATYASRCIENEILMYLRRNSKTKLEVSIDDLFQIGCIGLIKSIDNFNPDLQVKFSTYAVPMIIGEIRRYLRDNNSIRVSRSLRDTAYKAIHAKEVLSRNSFKEPTLQEIAAESGVAAEDILYALDAIQSPVSLYDPVYTDGGDTLYVMDQISDKKNKEENWVEKLSLSDAMNHLSERENFIINLRFFEGKTQMEVADEIHISQAQVSRLEKSALKTIRQYLTL